MTLVQIIAMLPIFVHLKRTGMYSIYKNDRVLRCVLFSSIPSSHDTFAVRRYIVCPLVSYISTSLSIGLHEGTTSSRTRELKQHVFRDSHASVSPV